MTNYNGNDMERIEKPKISIITVCLNAADQIRQTIESVLSQTYSKLEYVIIDGGSTDGTVDIIKHYQTYLAFWHSEKDRGVAHAFNKGLYATEGEWLLYLNADDFFVGPDTVTKMAPYLVQHKDHDVVFGRVIRMSNDDEPQPRPFSKIFGSPWRWETFRRSCSIPHQASFINRQYFERAGEFDEAFRIAMDYEHFLRGGRELKAKYIPIVLAGIREGGLSYQPIRSLNEARLAQQKNKSLSSGLAWINFFFLTARFYAIYTGHLIFDRLAPQTSLQDKISGVLLRKV